MYWSLLIFREHSTREPASSRVTDFILRAYTGTGVSYSQHKKNSGDVLEKMEVKGPEGLKLAREKSLAVSVACIAIYIDLPQAVNGEPSISVFSTDRTLISASAAPYCGGFW